MAFFTSSNPQFFKIILHQSLVQGKIDIPRKFVIDNGGGGSLFRRTATLRIPCGASWEVQVEKSDGKVSFTRGWPDFLKFYSVRVGYFIVFKLDGSSCFDVSVFDLSATEIDYPIKLQRSGFCRIPKDNSGGSSGLAPSLVVKIESESDEENGSFRKMRKKMKQNKNKNKNKRQLTVAQSFINDEDEDEDVDEDEDEDEDLDMNFSKRQSNIRGSGYKHDYDSESMRPMTPRKTPQPLSKNQEQVLRLASLFKCGRKNPSFLVTMRPSYIQTGCYLSLPRSFAERYVKESMDVKLELDDGRVWSVWCGVRWALTRRRTEFKGGWKTFTFDNKLQEGDSCVFELIHRSPIAFYKVTIFRRPLN